MQNVFSPVIVAIAESSNRDGEGLPHWVQRVLNHLRLMADGEPASKITDIRPLQGKHVYIAHIVPARIIPHDFGILCSLICLSTNCFAGCCVFLYLPQVHLGGHRVTELQILFTAINISSRQSSERKQSL